MTATWRFGSADRLAKEQATDTPAPGAYDSDTDFGRDRPTSALSKNNVLLTIDY